MELEQKLANAEEDVFELLENKKYNRLREIFDDFINAQLSADYIGRVDRIGKVYRMLHPCIVEIEDKYKELIIELLIRTERMSKAYKLLNLYGQKAEPTQRMKELREEIEAFRAAALDYSLGNLDDAFAKSQQLREKYPDNDQTMRMRLRLILESQERFNQYAEEAAELLSMLDERKPGDGEIAKYLGDMDRRLGGTKSEEYYRYALDHTYNGIIVLEIKRILDGDQ